MTGLAGSQGPWISFLYRCSPISHQLVAPMPRSVTTPPRITPKTAYANPPPEMTIPNTPEASTIRKIVSVRWSGQEWCLRCRRKTGKRPKTSMLNRVRLNTWIVDGSREARTVLAIKAAFVESEAGNLVELLAYSSCVKPGGYILRLGASTIVKCEHIDTHQPAA
jgi:hypothetical protein